MIWLLLIFVLLFCGRKTSNTKLSGDFSASETFIFTGGMIAIVCWSFFESLWFTIPLYFTASVFVLFSIYYFVKGLIAMWKVD